MSRRDDSLDASLARLWAAEEVVPAAWRDQVMAAVRRDVERAAQPAEAGPWMWLAVALATAAALAGGSVLLAPAVLQWGSEWLARWGGVLAALQMAGALMWRSPAVAWLAMAAAALSMLLAGVLVRTLNYGEFGTGSVKTR